MLLTVENLTKKFGGLVAVDDVFLEIKKETITGVIGPNGSGKTTLLNCINGFYVPENGTIRYKDKPIQGMKPHQVAKAGIGRTFQVPRIFKKMTIVENLMAPVLDSNLPDTSLREKALGYLGRVDMADLKDSLGEELSGGQQKLLEFVRLLMFDPDLVLLDEPFSGVHPVLKSMFHGEILDLRERGKTFILVSHDLVSVYTLSEEIIVLDVGKVIARGRPEDIKHNDRVIEAYLGK